METQRMGWVEWVVNGGIGFRGQESLRLHGHGPRSQEELGHSPGRKGQFSICESWTPGMVLQREAG